ncbi:hypothetical protein Bca52824_065947 [Brassica carinata]|uniref:DUF4283 domain-containing protein n=1 Tax=Brassica carinata TaxID=52824 RepID=A0A8X7QL35_BRACI|nr:hypothetical protein Bca52824_065947 [Brassica carinata]
MALSLEEEDKPFDMPDLPGFCSNEKNKLSLVGRMLNRVSKMSTRSENARKWSKEGKCRGVALSQERFQFFFDHEHDLLDVLEKGVHTFNEWALAIERWVEEPPDDYLQFISLWVRISNIPINYYTKEAIMALGDLVGEVKEFIFDPTKPQTQPYQRVLVKFNVANSLKMSRVGTGAVTGKPKIVKEVLDEMRQYLMLATDEDRIIREERVRSSVAAVEQDPMLQRTVLRLEAPPVISQDFNKGKGVVYSYEELQKPKEGKLQSEKFMASAIRAGSAGQWNAGNMDRTLSDEVYVGYNFMATTEGSTVFSTGSLEPCASAGTKKKVYQRRRPPKSRRKPIPLLLADKTEGVMWDKAADKSVVGSKKRKAETEVGELLVSAKSKTPKVIPREGSPNA